MEPLSTRQGPASNATRRLPGNQRAEWTHGQDPRLDENSLHQRLTDRARERWPQIERINTRFRAGFAYVDAILPGGEIQQLCRLRYGGYANQWGFAIYRASHDDYEDSWLPTGDLAWPAPPSKPSTPPAASISPTPPPGPEPPTN